MIPKQKFESIDPKLITENVFKMIGEDWMLITAGTASAFNTMTASWGSLGVLWNLPVANCFIRPHRYTFQFAERNEYFTLSFFDEKYRDILNFCGSKSGRDYNKAKETGLIPFSTEHGNIGFEQARLVMECKKLYAGDLNQEDFVVKSLIHKNYPKKDFHRFYIGEIVGVLMEID